MPGIGIGVGIGLGGGRGGTGDSTPGGTNDVLLLANATDGLLLADGSSFLKLAG